MIETGNKLKITPSTIYEICEYIDSYLHEVEQNISHDRKTLTKFRTNEIPFIVDILGDFGTFTPEMLVELNEISGWEKRVKTKDRLLHNIAICYTRNMECDFIFPENCAGCHDSGADCEHQF